MSRAALSSNTEKDVWSNVKKILKGSTGNWITFVLWIISISLDPFTCYVPSIDDKDKNLEINLSLLISIWVLYWSLLIYRISISFCTEIKGTRRVFNQVESIALLCSNVLLYSLYLGPKMEISAPVFSVVLGIFLAVYLVRIVGIYRMFSEEVTKSTSSKLAEAPIIKIVFNLLLFLYGGHLFGGLWYLFAIWKERECWKILESNIDIKPLNETCFAYLKNDTKPYETEIGIFKDAFESRIVEESEGLGKKLFYCFRWGIQNVSGFATNLQVSTYVWENIFVILIAIYGVGTFTFFIGNMQNLIMSAIEERRKRVDRAIKQQLQQWLTFEKLPKNLQNSITEYHQYSGQQTKGVDVKNLFRNLPEDIGNNIKHKLCLEQLKKVERFRMWSDASLRGLCDYIEPIVYDEHTRIVREGDPINKMLFVLDGQLVARSTNKLAASSTNNVSPKEILKGGDFWGEELVDWVLYNNNSSSSSKKLISLTKVEAFVLKIDGLKKLFHEKAKVIQSFFRKRRNNARCCEFGNLSLCRYRCAP